MFYLAVYMEGMNLMNKLKVLYEDNHVIVVLKEVNVPSQEDAARDMDLLRMVKQYVKEKYNKPGNVYIGLVHRLDRPTSGIMVFARSSKAASRLNDQIRNSELSKNYLCVVHGILDKKEGRFEDKLKKLDNGNTIVAKDGKEAVLEYKVIDENKEENLSLVSVKLITGRHHQIRVQFSSRGYPLYGDQRYGALDNKQLALHAYKLSFIHPVKKELMEYTDFSCMKREGFNFFNVANDTIL